MQSIKSCISQIDKTAKMKMFTSYNREIYALAHLICQTDFDPTTLVVWKNNQFAT